MNKNVLNAVKEAYIDSNSDLGWTEAEKRRNLHFRAPEPVSVAEAVEIMTEALCIESASELGYNNFKPSLLKKLPKGSKVQLAREGSVCVYVSLPGGSVVDLENLQKKMKADECDMDGTELRVWWD